MKISKHILAHSNVRHHELRGGSKKASQLGRSQFCERSLPAVREHAKLVRTPLVAFFNSPLLRLLWCWSATILIFSPTVAISFNDRIVAVVNKEVITWTDLQEEILDEYRRLKAKYQGQEFERRYLQKQREVLNGLIDERLQLQEAKDKGISVTQDEIDGALRRAPLPPTLTEEEFGQQMLLKKLFDFEVRRNVVIEDEELRRYYETNPNMFRTAPQYRLKQIFLATSSDDTGEQATAIAQAIYANWTPETALEDLAARHTQVVRELGWVEKKDLLGPLAQTVMNLRPGTLSKPVQTEAGVHLLMVEDVKESQPYPFEEVEREIREQLLKQRSDDAYREWLKELKQKAFIEVKL